MASRLGSSHVPAWSSVNRVLEILHQRRAPWVIAAVSLLLALPNLWLGFFADDFFILTGLEGDPLLHRPWYDLYQFATATSTPQLIARGAYPWWTQPDLHIHLWRPLSSALLALDHCCFGRHAFGYHLHSIGWLMFYVAAAWAFFKRTLSRSVAPLTLLILVLSPSLATPAGWPSARQLLVAGTLCSTGLVVAIGATGRPRRRWFAGLLLALGLFASEAGVAGLGYWICFELLGPSGASCVRARLKRCCLPLVLGALYFANYKIIGAGVHGSGVYVEPLSSPIEFAKLALVRVPVLMGDLLLGIISELSSFLPVWPLVLLGLLGATILAVLAWQMRAKMAVEDRQALRWLLPGAGFATLSVSGGFPGSRLLVLPMLGCAPLLAILIRLGFTEASRSPVRTIGLRAVAGLIAVTHLIVCPLGWIIDFNNRHRMARGVQSAVDQVAAMHTIAEKYIVWTSSDPMIWMYAPLQMFSERPDRSKCWCTLSAAKADLEVTRIGSNRFSVSPVGASLLAGTFERLYRSERRPFRLGDSVNQCGITISVTALSNGLPSRLDLLFHWPIDNPSGIFLAWRDGKLRQVASLPVGSTQRLGWSPGPSRVF